MTARPSSTPATRVLLKSVGRPLLSEAGYQPFFQILYDVAFARLGFVECATILMQFLDSRCTLERTISPYYFLGKRIPDAVHYPPECRYPEVEADYLQRVKI